MTAVLCLQYIFAEVKKGGVPGSIHNLFVKRTKHMVFLSLSESYHRQSHTLSLPLVDGNLMNLSKHEFSAKLLY